MAKVELTDKLLKAAKCEPGKRQTDYFDTTVKGLCFRVSAGGARSWFLVFTKPGDGKRAWLKIGTYPEIPLGGEGGARQRARDERAKIADGGDPVVEKKAAWTGLTVFDLVENYIVRKVAGKRSYHEIARRLRKNVSGKTADGGPWLDKEGKVTSSSGAIGDVKLSALHRRDLTRCIDAIKDRGADTEANRVFEDLRAMIRWARGRGDLDENLVEGMAKPSETVERDRALSADEIRTVWHGLERAEMREATRRVLKLCLVTGQRVGEVCGMAKGELDLDAALWVIPASRSKNKQAHIVPLSPLAVDLIKAQLADNADLARRKKRDDPNWIFPGPGARAAMTGAAVAKAVKREEVTKRGQVSIIGVAPWTPHDLRRTAATHMAEMRISPFIVGHILNHVSVTKATVTGRHYDTYDYATEKRQALEQWAERLEAIVSGKTAEIITLQRA